MLLFFKICFHSLASLKDLDVRGVMHEMLHGMLVRQKSALEDLRESEVALVVTRKNTVKDFLLACVPFFVWFPFSGVHEVLILFLVFP